MSRNCVGCNTPIPPGATKCPMCGAATPESQSAVVTIIPPPKDDDREYTVWEGQPEWKAFAPHFVLAVLTIPVFIISIILIAVALVNRFKYHFKVSNKRIICTTGIMSKHTSEIQINDIRSTNVSQGFLDRMLGVGKIEFSTASGPFKEAVLVNVADPVYLKEKIQSLRKV